MIIGNINSVNSTGLHPDENAPKKFGRYNSDNTVVYRNIEGTKSKKRVISTKACIWVLLIFLVIGGITATVLLLVLKKNPSPGVGNDQFNISLGTNIPDGAVMSVSGNNIYIGYGNNLTTVSITDKSSTTTLLNGTITGMCSSFDKTFIAVGNNIIDNDGNIIHSRRREDREFGVMAYSSNQENEVVFIAGRNSSSLSILILQPPELISNMEP